MPESKEPISASNSTELPLEGFRSVPVFSPLFSPVLHTQRHPHPTPLTSYISALYSLSGPAYPDCRFPNQPFGIYCRGKNVLEKKP